LEVKEVININKEKRTLFTDQFAKELRGLGITLNNIRCVKSPLGEK
jgi:hypothetical protein